MLKCEGGGLDDFVLANMEEPPSLIYSLSTFRSVNRSVSLTLATAIFITRIVAYHLTKEWRRSPNYLHTQVTVASEYSRWVPMLLLSPLRCSIFRLQSCTWHCIESKPNRNRIAFFLTYYKAEAHDFQRWNQYLAAQPTIALEARTWEQILASQSNSSQKNLQSNSKRYDRERKPLKIDTERSSSHVKVLTL